MGTVLFSSYIATDHEMESLPLSEQKREIDKLKKQAMESKSDYVCNIQ